MLAAALGYCRGTLGLTRVLITCAQTNAASRRFIEANGGVLENILDGECRYWAGTGEGGTAGVTRKRSWAAGRDAAGA